MIFATNRGDDELDDVVRCMKGCRASRARDCVWSIIMLLVNDKQEEPGTRSGNLFIFFIEGGWLHSNANIIDLHSLMMIINMIVPDYLQLLTPPSHRIVIYQYPLRKVASALDLSLSRLSFGLGYVEYSIAKKPNHVGRL